MTRNNMILLCCVLMIVHQALSFRPLSTRGGIRGQRQVFDLSKTSLSKTSLSDTTKDTRTPVATQGDGGAGASEETLVWDEKENRFFERNLDEVCEDEFCLLDEESGENILLTKSEKERVFLDTIQSYYYNSSSSSLTDEEFNKLKEDLSWEGSALVTLSREELLFVEAVQAYNKDSAKPMISDTEFDALKTKLRDVNSPIAVSDAPKIYADTGVCKVTWTPDNVKQGTLYAPASILTSLVTIGVLDELPFIRDINIIILFLAAATPISIISRQLTENVLFKDPFIAKGPCPKCEVINRVYFGDVLGVEGDREESSVKCTNCKEVLTIKKSTLRVSTLPPKKVER